eukprot:1544415-Rhodomonas_salina.1
MSSCWAICADGMSSGRSDDCRLKKGSCTNFLPNPGMAEIPVCKIANPDCISSKDWSVALVCEWGIVFIVCVASGGVVGWGLRMATGIC